MKPQELAKVMMVGSHILSPPPEPKLPQIMTTTFEAKGVRLGPQQLQKLKALAIE